ALPIFLLLDKTGTITAARAEVVAVEPFGSISTDELVRYAASVEQVSVHPFASAILAEAHRRGVEVSFPTNVPERMGTGLAGLVEGHQIAVGQLQFAAADAPRTAQLRSVESRTTVEGSSSVFVSIDGALAGVLLLQDPVR